MYTNEFVKRARARARPRVSMRKGEGGRGEGERVFRPFEPSMRAIRNRDFLSVSQRNIPVDLPTSPYNL